MALISPSLAIVSVGVSCQPAQQLRLHMPYLARLIGEPFEVHTTPWDWTICGPAGVAAMLEDGCTLPPADQLEDRDGKPYWPERACYFWHMKGAITHHAEALAQADRQRSHLEAVARAGRKVFILANTQNNVARVTKSRGGFDPFIRSAEVDSLGMMLGQRFGKCELWIVSRPQLHDLDRRPWRLIELEPDRSTWEGSQKQWTAALGRIVSA